MKNISLCILVSGKIALLSPTLMMGTAQAFPIADEDLKTEKVVMLLRHGVRASLVSKEIEHYSTCRWPALEANEVEVGAHGRAAMRQWGHYHKRRLLALGLLLPARTLGERQVVAFSGELREPG